MLSPKGSKLPVILVVVFSLLLLMTSVDSPTAAQGDPCDPNLSQRSGDPNGYRMRGDRCEGTYEKDVGGAIFIASLTEYVEDFDPAGGRLRIEWTAPGSENVRVRAYALRHRFYFRMDSLRPAGDSFYEWPTYMLAAFKLRKSELGVVSLTSSQVGDKKREIYLPVRIRQKGVTGNSSNYQLVLWHDKEVDNVYLSMVPVGHDGSPGVSKDWELGPGEYPAGHGINILIPQGKTPGIYFLKIRARFKGSGSTSIQEVWFYQPGN